MPHIKDCFHLRFLLFRKEISVCKQTQTPWIIQQRNHHPLVKIRLFRLAFCSLNLSRWSLDNGAGFYPSAAPAASIHTPGYGGSPINYGEFPVSCTCIACNQQIVTATSKERGLAVWLAVLILICIVVGLPFCCIPCCIDSLKVNSIDPYRSLIESNSHSFLGHPSFLSKL